MKLIFSLILSIYCATSPNHYVDDFCNVYGIIYFEKNQYAADAMVYMEEDETQANLLVFKEDNRLFADEEGVWYITDNPAIANYRLFITKDIRNADFTAHYIEERSFAGCQ